jgi:carbamoylphosphate synthase large subunit
MGHVTAIGASTEEALARARAAVDLLLWTDDTSRESRDQPS